jgi:orotate phosphoribosyltransferase
MSDQTQEDYKELTLLPKLRQWTDRLKGQSQNNSSIQEVTRLARDLGAERAARLLGEALWLKSKDSPLPRYPPDDVTRILRRCALRTEEPVGLEKRLYLKHYIQISQLAPQDDDLTKLACVLCHIIRDECNKTHIRPTRVAVPKTGPIEFGRRVAQLLDYPLVYVAPQGPNNSLRVEGSLNPGDEVILVHDIILSGETLVKCAVEVRKKAANLVHVFTLVHYSHPECDPHALLSCNGLDLHTSQTVTPDWFSFLSK